MKTLKTIKQFIDKEAGYDISIKLRNAEAVNFRTLYCKLAIETTKETLGTIGEEIKRDHATVIHSRKLFDEIMSIEKYREIYYDYRKNILGLLEKESYKDEKQYNQLKDKFNNAIMLLKEYERNGVTLGLTINEHKYRKLTKEEQHTYNERAELVLKSFEWKRKDANRKEVFEIINVGGGGLDARGIL